MKSLKFNFTKRINWPNSMAEVLVVFLGVSAGFILIYQKERFINTQLMPYDQRA